MAGGSGPRSVSRMSPRGSSGPRSVSRSTSHISVPNVGKSSSRLGFAIVAKRGGGKNSGPNCGGGGHPKMAMKAMGKSGGGVNVGGANASAPRTKVRMGPKGYLRGTEKE